MGWKQAVQYAKGVAAKHGIESAQKEAHADDDLPLGGRIGGLVRMQMSPFIRAITGGSLVSMPDSPDGVIVAISRVRLNLDGKLHRFYLGTGDDNEKDERFIQVYTDADGEVRDILYCTGLTRVIPQTEEEQNIFTGSGGSGLGQKTYSLWREQMAAIGIEEPVLQAVFAENESIEFTRDANVGQDFLPPFEGAETRVDDVNGEHGLAQSIYFMPYVRDIGGDKEYLLISTEIIESQDGDESRRAIHVDFMVGLALEKERIIFQ